MTLRELRQLSPDAPPADLPRLGPNDYTLLWTSGYWDGALSGMLLVHGTERWFELLDTVDEETDELPTRRDRRYAVLALTPEKLAKENEVYRDFQRYVGTHWDAVGPNELRPQNQWHLFYDKHYEYCRSMRFEDNEVVAWFVGAPPGRTIT